MAYSSIGHMGYALVGLAAGTPEGVQGVLVYMAIYLAMTLGTFACILVDAARRRGWSRTSTTSPASRAPIRRWRSSSPCCCSRSPAFRRSPASSPSIYVFLAAIKAGLYALAVIGVLASVVGAYYYLRIVKIMYFDEPAAPFEPMPRALKVVLGDHRRVHAAVLRLSRRRWSTRRTPRRSRCSDASSSQARALRASASSPTRRSARPTPRRWRARAPASAGRSGSRRRARPPAAAGAAGPGPREPGNLYASLLLTDPAPPAHRPSSASWRRWRCTTRSARRRPRLRAQLS